MPALQKLPLKEITTEIFIKHITESRNLEGKSVSSYKFNKSRCRIVSDCKEVKEDCNGIIYWMCRDYRVQDNWALLFAQKLAIKNRVPLFVCIFGKPCVELLPTVRHYKFYIEGLKEVENECNELNIKFCFINSTPEDLPKIVVENNIGAVVFDFFPLRKLRLWEHSIKANLPTDVSFVQIDAHNIVPAWVTSEKKEMAARTIRPKINKKLDEFLVGFPIVARHEYPGKLKLKNGISLEEAMGKFEGRKCSRLPEIKWAKPGSKSGLDMLRSFITERLKMYASSSSDPSKNACSNLSPWIHFGQISPQRCALEVKLFREQFKESVEKFLEELIVRRELSDNFCLYNPNYDNITGADKWAIDTLNEHSEDKREYLYPLKQFEEAKTHDDIWNAAQNQLVIEGKLQGYMRMYWCKKILEWTACPEEAIDYALTLNDTYSLDGSDPNGFVGVMWSICGVHDHGWKEREIFGKVRFMVDYSLRRKYKLDGYIAKYTNVPKAMIESEETDSNDKEPRAKKQKV